MTSTAFAPRLQDEPREAGATGRTNVFLNGIPGPDAGELDEFPGTPDTKGEVFTVNCPVPVLAPVTSRA